MLKIEPIVYSELDFLLPIQRFRIEYSTTGQKRLSFMREFVLRIVNIEPVKPAVIGQYFGLTPFETNEALGDLVEKGYIQFTDEDLVKLTHSGSELFGGEIDSTPEISAIEDNSGVFSFDLISYNYCGSQSKRENWQRGIRLDVSLQSRANSQQNAFDFFQKRFDTILDRGDIRKYDPDDYDAKRPQIYKMGEISKLGEAPIRIPIRFQITGELHERSDPDSFEDADEIAVAITDAIDKLRFVETDFTDAWTLFGDTLSPNLCSESTLHVSDLISIQESAVKQQDSTIPFVGALTSPNVWETIDQVCGVVTNKMTDSHQDGLNQLTWLIPANPVRCKTDMIARCISDLSSKSKVAGKKNKTLFNLELLLPVSGNDDRQAKNTWPHEITEAKSYCKLYDDGFESYKSIFDGNLELMVLPGEFAVVCYHFYRQGITPVPIPFGFITTDKDKVSAVSQFIECLSSEQISHDEPRILGKL